MSKDLIFGMAIICSSLVCIFIIVLWSRKTFERIRKKKQQSAREIIQDIDGRK